MNLVHLILCGEATLDVLDFLPLSEVDYSGGVIISDWYTDNTNKNQALKITVRFYQIQFKQIV